MDDVHGSHSWEVVARHMIVSIALLDPFQIVSQLLSYSGRLDPRRTAHSDANVYSLGCTPMDDRQSKEQRVKNLRKKRKRETIHIIH